MALFSLSATLLPPPACIAPSDNEAISSLVSARLITQRWLAPGGLRLTTNWCASLTTSMRMITWVHNRSTNGGATTHMTRTPGFTDATSLMINVAYLPGGRHTKDMDIALLTGRQAEQCVVTFFRHQLSTNACATHYLTAAATLQ